METNPLTGKIQALERPIHAYLVLICLLPPTCFFGLQWLVATLELPTLWSLLVPWFGSAATLAGLWRYVYYDMNTKLWQPLGDQQNCLDRLANDLKLSQARRAAAHHYVDRLDVHLELSRANSIALSQSLNERLQTQLIFQQAHKRLALLALQNQQSVTGHILKLASQAEQGWHGNVNAWRDVQTAAAAVDFYLTELDALASDSTQPLQTEFAALPTQNLTYDLRACVHEAITLVQPYLAIGKSGTQHEIWPVYEPSCAVEFYGDKRLIRRAIFHYLLAMLDEFACPTQTSAILRISFTKKSDASSRIKFQLENDLLLDPQERQSKWQHDQQRRLLQLPSKFGVKLSHTGIYLNAQPTQTTFDYKHGLTARIYPRDEKQKIGLESCLQELNIKVTQHQVPDLCIIGLTADNAIKDITDKLDLATTVILLNSARIYQQADWHVLPVPLHYQTLIDCIHLHAVRQRQPNILVVDDDKNARLFLCTLLREYGANTHEADDGVAALATAATESLDLIFMDIHMPRMNGLEATRQLRVSLDRSLPIIALTAHVINSERAAIVDAGMSATLLKPVDSTTLRQVLQQWIQNGRVRQLPNNDQPPTITPVFDTHLALQIANQRPQLAIEMLSLFMQSLDADQENLRQAHSDNDLEQFSQQIHRLNGAAKFCGIPRIQVLLQNIETQLKTSNQQEVVQDVAQQLHIEFNALRDWYQTTANPLASQAKTTHQPSKIT
jgi:CheY-like chemotaxis protein/HPt (histidine-containing phosphotransfer) domain-containing protein